MPDGINGTNGLDRANSSSSATAGKTSIFCTASGNDLQHGDHDMDAAEQGQNGKQAPVIYYHEWQHAIYEGRKIPDDHRYCAGAVKAATCACRAKDHCTDTI